jgi:hypothetical protein
VRHHSERFPWVARPHSPEKKARVARGRDSASREPRRGFGRWSAAHHGALVLLEIWGGFKALRARWSDRIASTLRRPVLIMDEAQEALTPALSELRILASKDLDSRQLLSVVLAGDARLPERLRVPHHGERFPWSRAHIRRRRRRRGVARRNLGRPWSSSPGRRRRRHL